MIIWVIHSFLSMHIAFYDKNHVIFWNTRHLTPYMHNFGPICSVVSCKLIHYECLFMIFIAPVTNVKELHIVASEDMPQEPL